jgi:hypothetical protein
VTAWYASNFKTSLSKLLVGGVPRRVRLVATASTYVGLKAFVQFGGFVDHREALRLYDNDTNQFARKMLLSDSSRVDGEARTRLADVDDQWHLVLPALGIKDLAGDANVLLDLILLYAASRTEGRPSSSNRPDLPPHCSKILDRLIDIKNQETEKISMKRKREDEAGMPSSGEQEDTTKCLIIDHPVVNTFRSGPDVKLSELVRSNGKDGRESVYLGGCLQLHGPAYVYEHLFNWFYEYYEPCVSPPDAQNAASSFHLGFLVERLRHDRGGLWKDVQAITKGGARAGSVRWMFDHLNHAIDLRNGNRYDDLGGEECVLARFLADRLPRLTGTQNTIRNATTFTAFTGRKFASLTMVVTGWRTRLTPGDNNNYAQNEIICVGKIASSRATTAAQAGSSSGGS